MTDLSSPETLDIEEQLDEAFPRVSWRTTRPDWDFLHRWSLQHRAPENADKTLCGLYIQWTRFGPGDSRPCQRCDSIAAKRIDP